MNPKTSLIATGCLSLFFAGIMVHAGVKIIPGKTSPYTKTTVSSCLYTKPSQDATGGIKGEIVAPPSEIMGIVAMPQRFSDVTSMADETGTVSVKNARNANQQMTNQVYLAQLNDDNTFSFSGLPPGKYDLIVHCEKSIYEGLLLTREKHTLTDKDIQTIKEKIDVSNPFYNTKKAARLIGQTGRYGKARIIGQEVRTLPLTTQAALVYKDVQVRSIKLYLFESVATTAEQSHWEMLKSREIFRYEAGPPDLKGFISMHFCKALQGFRVSTTVKDVGKIKLTTDEDPAVTSNKTDTP